LISLVIAGYGVFFTGQNTSDSNLTYLTDVINVFPHADDDGLYVSNFGKTVAVGDVNGDGINDVVVCSDQWIYAYKGPFDEQSSLGNVEGPDPMLKIGNPYWTPGHQVNPVFYDMALADVNGDGIKDIISGNSYGLYAFYGKSEWGTSNNLLELSVSNCDWYLSDPNVHPDGATMGFAEFVANMGDINADGIDDIGCGAPNLPSENQYGLRAGKAYLFYGSTLGLPPDHNADFIMVGAQGSPDNLPLGPGDAYYLEVGVQLAKDGHTLDIPGIPLPADRFMIGMPGSGLDVNHNGQIDETEHDIGIAFIGPVIRYLSGDKTPNSHFGYSLGNAGDTNGDGNSEVIVCAKSVEAINKTITPAKVFLYVGTSNMVDDSSYSWSVENIPFRDEPAYIRPSDQRPPVGSAGDVNGDGYGDIFIGDSSYNPDYNLGADGRVYIWFGGPSSAQNPSGLRQGQTPETADIILGPRVGVDSENSWVSFGWDVSSGDLNHDILSDIAVGDPDAFHPLDNTVPGTQTGAVHIYLSSKREGFGFDFGTHDSPVANGYIRVTESSLYSESIGYGWRESGGLISHDRNGEDFLRRDFVEPDGFTGLNYTFLVDLPNGEYRVKMLIGDSNYGHGPIDVLVELEGEKVYFPTISAGVFEEPSFTTIVRGGTLAIQFLSLSRGGPHSDWVINAIQIEPT
jgi:hypothetical protein